MIWPKPVLAFGAPFFTFVIRAPEASDDLPPVAIGLARMLQIAVCQILI
jgi:hypothetical protein